MELVEILRQQPVLTLFTILGIGYLIGGIKIGNFSFGPVAGVLFAGLFFGNFDFRISAGAQSVGFALFIFSVGYQAGPRFFDVLKTDGLKYFLLALVIAVSGFAVAMLATLFFKLTPGTSAGILAGGLTSSPTLAAAQQAIGDGTVSAPQGWSADQVIGNIATGYAITYIFGLAGLIAIIKLLPGILGIDLAERSKQLEKQEASGSGVAPANVSMRAYRVVDEALTRLSASEFTKLYPIHFSGAGRVVRNGELVTLREDDRLKLGDQLVIWGDQQLFIETLKNIGEEVVPHADLSEHIRTARVVITHKEVIGKTIAELNLPREFYLTLLGVRRMRIPLKRSSDLELRKGDILTVMGSDESIEGFGEAVGVVDEDVAETDMLTFSIGIALGVVIGMISIEIGGISVGLGSAGGLVLSGIIIGFLRSSFPTFGRLPDAARWILMELGLLIFMAGVGLRAGGDIIETFLKSGPVLIAAGILVTFTPVLVGYLFGRKVLRIEPVLLFGAICGAMTSGASLSVVTGAAKSSYPALGYAGTYAFANILLTVAGSIILLF